MKPNEQLLLQQLELSQEELKQTYKEIGPCDHDVGICVCNLRNLIEDNGILIGRYK